MIRKELINVMSTEVKFIEISMKNAGVVSLGEMGTESYNVYRVYDKDYKFEDVEYEVEIDNEIIKAKFDQVFDLIVNAMKNDNFIKITMAKHNNIILVTRGSSISHIRFGSM